MHDSHLHIGNGDTFLFKPRWSGILNPSGSFQGVKRFPCFIQQLADFLGSLGRELFIPQILFMGFFLIIPVRILFHPCFFVMLTLVITDIPELGCCIAHMPDEVRIFLYKARSPSFFLPIIFDLHVYNANIRYIVNLCYFFINHKVDTI